MPRGKRVTIDEGIYRDDIGVSATVGIRRKQDDGSVRRVQRERRFSRTYPLRKIRDWQQETRAKLLAGIEPNEPEPEPDSTPAPSTFRTDVPEYLKARAAMPTIKERTTHMQEWIAVFEDRPRASIRAVEIMARRDRWLTEKRTGRDGEELEPYSASSVNHRLRALRNFFTTMNGRRGDNPAADVAEAIEPDEQARALPHALVELIFDAMPPSKARARLRVMRGAGIPPKQVGQLNRPDVDLKARSVQTARRKKGRGAGGGLKPLTAAGVQAFREFIREDAFGTFSMSPVRRAWDTAKAHVKDQLRKDGALTPQLARALDDATPYWLRHTFGSEALRATKNLGTVGALLDHADPRTTRRYALAEIPAYLRDAAVQMDKVARASRASRNRQNRAFKGSRRQKR